MNRIGKEKNVEKGEKDGYRHFILLTQFFQAPPEWLSGECVGLMTWWL